MLANIWGRFDEKWKAKVWIKMRFFIFSDFHLQINGKRTKIIFSIQIEKKKHTKPILFGVIAEIDYHLKTKPISKTTQVFSLFPNQPKIKSIHFKWKKIFIWKRIYRTKSILRIWNNLDNNKSSRHKVNWRSDSHFNTPHPIGRLHKAIYTYTYLHFEWVRETKQKLKTLF